jgi:acetoacetate decarboxylase
MNYPSAPWNLKGYGFLTLHLIDVTAVTKFIPPKFEIISVLPGKTIGGIALGNYGSGSTLTYSELITIAGLVRQNGQIGTWISHIYVDDQTSISGGREIWGLPKEFAEFHWQPNGNVRVQQPDQSTRILCDFNHNWHLNFWRQGGDFSSFSRVGTEIAQFGFSGAANLAIVGANLTVPPESPFSGIITAPPVLALRAEGLDLTVNPPLLV